MEEAATGKTNNAKESIAVVREPPIGLKELTSQSSLVVIGRVSRIAEGAAKNSVGKLVNVAYVEIRERLKGESSREVCFVSSKLSSCDISRATVNETVVLFLAKPQNGELSFLKKNQSQIYFISASGRGRMPVMMAKDGLEYIRVPGGVEVPVSDKDNKPIWSEREFDKSIILGLVTDAIKGVNRKKTTPYKFGL